MRHRSQTDVRRGRDVNQRPLAERNDSRHSSTSPAPLVNKTRSASAFASSTTLAVSNDVPQTLLTVDESATLQRRSTEITRFRVFARVRPFIEEELWEIKDGILRSVVEISGKKTILLDPREEWSPKAEFEFDASLWSIPPTQKLQVTFQDALHETHQTQLDVYKLVAKPSVVSAFDGFNSCIMTYGQTGSGKTYTMMGKYNPTLVCGGDGEEGIIPRVCNDIFQLLEDKRAIERLKPEADRIAYRIEVNFVEIYLERVRDLLDPTLRNTKDAKLNEAKIRQDPACGPYVEGVTRYQVENWGHCCQLLERGSQHRTTCATLVHQQSSRSHAIFQITIMMEETVPAKDRYSLPSTRTRAGRINLVDLAGSERGGMTEYVKESAAINTSLLALRRVIDNLVERQNILLEQARQQIVNSGSSINDRSLPQVPFRDSVLTWLLSDSIGGNARTTMVATLSPLAKNYADTLATLQWSSKARNLVTLVKMNDVQTVVSDGMTSKASELNHAVVLQRQNVDSLRDALQQKQNYSDLLDRDTKAVMKLIIQENALLDEVRRLNATLVIQRAWRLILHQRRLDNLAVQIAAVETRISGERDALEIRRREILDAQQSLEENETLLVEAMNDQDEATSEAERVNSTQAEFDLHMAALQEHYDMISGQRGKDKETCQRDTAELQVQVDKLEQDVNQVRSETEKTDTRINQMIEVSKKLQEPGWTDVVSRSIKELAEITAKTDALKRRKFEGSAKRDLLKAQRDKLYPR